MLSIKKKSYVVHYVMTLQLFGTLKSCAFREITKRYLIDSTLWVELSWKLCHVKRSHEIITFKGNCEDG